MIFSFNRERVSGQERAAFANENAKAFPELVETFKGLAESKKPEMKIGVPFFDDIRKELASISDVDTHDSVARKIADRFAAYIDKTVSLDGTQAVAYVVAVARVLASIN